MIFQYTIDKVLDGSKTQTRRIYKPNKHYPSYSDNTYWAVYGVQGAPPIYEVGHTYAVQPGRGKKSVARIRVTSIRLEDVRCISQADVEAEGFTSRGEFLETWSKMHDVTAHGYLNCDMRFGVYHLPEYGGIPAHGYETWHGYLMNRPAERYKAWTLTFCLVATLNPRNAPFDALTSPKPDADTLNAAYSPKSKDLP